MDKERGHDSYDPNDPYGTGLPTGQGAPQGGAPDPAAGPTAAGSYGVNPGPQNAPDPNQIPSSLSGGPGGPGGPGGQFPPPGAAGPYGVQPAQDAGSGGGNKTAGIVIGAVAVLTILVVAAAFFLTSGSESTDASGTSAEGADSTAGAGDTGDSGGAGDTGGSGPSGSGSSWLDFGSGASGYEVDGCLFDDDPEGTSMELPAVVDCDSPEATHRILAVRASDSDTKCIDVHGASLSFQLFGVSDVDSLCVAGIDEDIDANINLIQVGECVTLQEEPEVDAFRADCGDPNASQVLAVLEDPGYISGVYFDEITECAEAGVPEALNIYSWGLSGYGLTYDRAICLT